MVSFIRRLRGSSRRLQQAAGSRLMTSSDLFYQGSYFVGDQVLKTAERKSLHSQQDTLPVRRCCCWRWHLTYDMKPRVSIKKSPLINLKKNKLRIWISGKQPNQTLLLSLGILGILTGYCWTCDLMQCFSNFSWSHGTFFTLKKIPCTSPTKVL